MNIIKRIDLEDVFIVLGLAMVGSGSYLWFGLPVSLVITGALVLMMGLYIAGVGADRGRKGKK